MDAGRCGVVVMVDRSVLYDILGLIGSINDRISNVCVVGLSKSSEDSMLTRCNFVM
jgi:hypothetical protein